MPEKRTPTRTTKVTLNDVARLAGVDRSVVSRVVNNDPNLNIRSETRDRVQSTIDKLGYRPNAAARSLRTAKAYMYALFIPDFTNPVYAEIITGAERAAVELGYGLMTASSEAVRRGQQHYLDLIAQGRVDGLLFAGEEPGHELERLRATRVPWLLVNRRITASDRYVILDDEKAAALAVGHLLTLGHRRIAHLAGPPEADTARRRRTGYTEALAAAGLSSNPGDIVHADYTPTGGAEAMHRLLSHPNPPTAVFVANLASAVGALHTAHELGISIPHDLSVVAVHDSALAGHLVPALTTVRMPLERVGGRALELLARHGPDEAITEIVTEPVELVVRQSTAPPTTHSGRPPRIR